MTGRSVGKTLLTKNLSNSPTEQLLLCTFGDRKNKIHSVLSQKLTTFEVDETKHLREVFFFVFFIYIYILKPSSEDPCYEKW